MLLKDGKPYKTFSRPNPLMTDQSFFRLEDLEFHNFHWTPTVVLGEPPIVRPTPKKQESFLDSFNKPSEIIRKEIESVREDKTDTSSRKRETLSPIPAPEPKPEPVVPKPNIPVEDPDFKSIIFVNCLPAETREVKDELYGETRKYVKYGSKFQFEAYLLSFNDLEVNLRTNQELTNSSIILIGRYKSGEDLELRNCWRVKSCKSTEKGFIVLAEITNQEVDFSK